MAFFSSEEKNFLKLLNSQGIRVDGRKFFDNRKILLEANIYTTCFSSIKISNGDNSLILCLKGEVVSPENFEIKMSFEPKIKDDKETTEILSLIESIVIRRITHESLFPSLREYSWKLYIDIFSTESLNTSMVQLLSEGVYSLLREAEIPKIEVFQNQINNNQKEYVILSENIDLEKTNLNNVVSNLPETKQTMKINTESLNKLFFFGISDNNLILDPSSSELAIVSSYVVLLLDKNGKTLDLQAVRANIDLKKIDEINSFIELLST